MGGYSFMKSNYYLWDKSLSIKAKGLLAFMLSEPSPDIWDYSIIGLSKVLKEGKTAIGNVLNELIEHKYVIRSQKRNKYKFSGWKYDVYDTPQ